MGGARQSRVTPRRFEQPWVSSRKSGPPRQLLRRHDESARNSGVQGRELGAMGVCKFEQMAIGGPRGVFAPRRQVCRTLVVGDERMGLPEACEHFVERLAGFFNGDRSSGSLHGNPDESQLRDGRTQKFSSRPAALVPNPSSHSAMIGVLFPPPGHQYIDV